MSRSNILASGFSHPGDAFLGDACAKLGVQNTSIRYQTLPDWMIVSSVTAGNGKNAAAKKEEECPKIVNYTPSL